MDQGSLLIPPLVCLTLLWDGRSDRIDFPSVGRRSPVGQEHQPLPNKLTGVGFATVLQHAVGRFEGLLNEAVVVPVEMAQKYEHNGYL